MKTRGMGEPRGSFALTLCGMAGSLLLIERWSDALVAALAFAPIFLWVYPVRPRALLSRLIPFVIFAVIAFAFGALGDGAFGSFEPSTTFATPAVSRAGLAALRLILLGLVASWIGLYVGAARMIAFFAAVGRASRRVGVDLSVPLLAMGVAIRFLPLVQEEARRLQVAWEARGGGLGGGVRYAIAVTVPLMAAALRRAEALAEAIDVRLGGSSFQRAELWKERPVRIRGHEARVASWRWVAVAAAWSVVALRVWRWGD